VDDSSSVDPTLASGHDGENRGGVGFSVVLVLRNEDRWRVASFGWLQAKLPPHGVGEVKVSAFSDLEQDPEVRSAWPVEYDHTALGFRVPMTALLPNPGSTRLPLPSVFLFDPGHGPHDYSSHALFARDHIHDRRAAPNPIRAAGRPTVLRQYCSHKASFGLSPISSISLSSVQWLVPSVKLLSLIFEIYPWLSCHSSILLMADKENIKIIAPDPISLLCYLTF
jgi:hypothetical protein